MVVFLSLPPSAPAVKAKDGGQGEVSPVPPPHAAERLKEAAGTTCPPGMHPLRRGGCLIGPPGRIAELKVRKMFRLRASDFLSSQKVTKELPKGTQPLKTTKLVLADCISFASP